MLLTSVLLLLMPAAVDPCPPPVSVTINGLEVTLDARTGSVLKLEHQGAGSLLKSERGEGGLLELACPVERFETLRRASRYSDNAEVQAGRSRLSVHWPDLGLSRSLNAGGRVEATVTFEAAADGASVIVSCEVLNHSSTPVAEVLFPDLWGFPPFAGEGSTWLRSAGFVIDPWTLLAAPTRGAPFYAQGPFGKGQGWVEYTYGGWGLNQMVLPWLDLGGYSGGLSMHTRMWGWDNLARRYSVLLHLSEASDRLRLLCRHPFVIEPGGRWRSPEFWLTPHGYGWAEGIKPYRAFVSRHHARDYAVPEHVKEGLGYRTVYMTPGSSEPMGDAIYRYEDLPRVAAEASDHGLDELVVWFWGPVFQLPMETWSALGTREDFLQAISDCEEMGVNVSPFISVFALANPSAARYGFELAHGWTYHPEFVPMMNPPYASGGRTASASANHPDWQRDAYDSITDWMDAGMTSLCWDVWYAAGGDTPNLLSLTKRIRDYARELDPQSVFAGESQDRIEIESRFLDYTWNWRDYGDIRAYANAFPSPRLNINVNRSPLDVKQGFMDGTYLNVMPSAPDGVNGSAMITQWPELSSALKTCARLRRRFLAYFTEGTVVGECLLTGPVGGCHASAFVRPGRALLILMNLQAGPARLAFECDLGHWLGGSGPYDITPFREDGASGRARTAGPLWAATTPELDPGEMFLHEITGQ